MKKEIKTEQEGTTKNAPSSQITPDALMEEAMGKLATKDEKSAEQQKDEESFIRVSRFGQYVEEGRGMEPPVELVNHVLVEHETTILFGDTGLGKSTYAMQIAIQVAQTGINVLYVNFELSQQQWAQRFPEKQLPESLMIANIDYAMMRNVTDQQHILEAIQQTALKHDTSVLIVDNLTNLCINSKDGAEAGNIMLQLISLRMTHNWTMLILAHVPKRKAIDPLSLNDLAGSKVISNMVDNVVAINKSKQHKDMRYLIQLKCRSFPIELDAKNVQEMTMTSSEGWLHFNLGGYSDELSHLPRSRDEKAELEHEIVKTLKAPDKASYRDIAEKLGTSLGMVQRTAEKYGLARKAAKQKRGQQPSREDSHSPEELSLF